MPAGYIRILHLEDSALDAELIEPVLGFRLQQARDDHRINEHHPVVHVQHHLSSHDGHQTEEGAEKNRKGSEINLMGKRKNE